jgi:glucosylceramidase
MRKQYNNKLSQVTLLLLLAPSAAAPLFAQNNKPVQPKSYDVANKTSKVYTTADHSDLRLTENGTLNFKELKQPLETQICIFVDPTITTPL